MRIYTDLADNFPKPLSWSTVSCAPAAANAATRTRGQVIIATNDAVNRSGCVVAHCGWGKLTWPYTYEHVVLHGHEPMLAF